MNFKWGGRAEEVGLDFTGQLQEVHHLNDARPRDTLTRSNAGLGQTWISRHLLSPTQREIKGMSRELLLYGSLDRLEVYRGVSVEGDGVDNEWCRPPS
jgi:hypothetical protein